MSNLLRLDGVELKAVCDIREEACVKARRQAEAMGKREPTAYTRGERDFERMCETEDLDLVYTATPWEWHVPVCLAAMRNGKHAATEVPAAITLEECWQLVETAEQTGKYCVDDGERQLHARGDGDPEDGPRGAAGRAGPRGGRYVHDTRYLKIRDYGDGLWLGAHFAKRNGNLYPMHGLGPLAWYLDINRGDRLDYLVSMSSRRAGWTSTRGAPPRGPSQAGPEIHQRRREFQPDPDRHGVTIILKHDTDLPRPYSRTNLVQGTRGIVRGFPEFKVCLEG